MDETLIAPMLDEGVSVDARRDGANYCVKFSGNADMRVKERIQKLLLEVHLEVCRQHISEVLVDLRELAFMSSSCIKAFVTWLMRVQSLAPEEQYRIHFLSAPESHWQRRSLTALSCVAAKLVTISEG
jgi:anti-anti-sigma factor